MACDIHQNTYLYHKKRKRYVNAADVFGYDITYWFPELVPDRCYRIFGMINGVRDNRHTICGTGYDFPKCVDAIFKELYNEHGSGLHSKIWFTASDLKIELKKKKEKILQNKKVFDDLSKKYHGDELYDKLEEYAENCDDYDSVWDKEDDPNYISYINEILFKLDTHYFDEDVILDKFDLKKTIILFYFDS